MLVYRICRAEFATNLNASGFAGRWNQEGQKVLYASATRSLAALEHLANRSGIVVKSPYRVMVLEVPSEGVDSVEAGASGEAEVPTDADASVDANAIRSVLISELPVDWRRLSFYGRLQEIGATWYRSSESLLLRVPSVLIPQECNYLINTQHPDFENRVRMVGVEEFDWDTRLF